LILAGIDEAGYGPRLGPLVVAASALRTSREIDAGGQWPQWRLRYCRAVKIADSKKLYSPHKGIGPLEKAVLSFAALVSSEAGRLRDFLERRALEGAREALGLPWYSGRCDIPSACDGEEVKRASASVKRCLDREGLEYLGSWICVVDAVRYNRIVERVGNKATLLFGRASILMRMLWREFGHEGVYLTVDRHGGRKFYGALMDIAFPHTGIDVLSESEDCSIYRLYDDGREMWVRFKVRADAADTTAALSSMWAKYTRELFMDLFNRYWLARARGVKKTAGYWGDGDRFLADLMESQVIDAGEAARFTRTR